MDEQIDLKFGLFCLACIGLNAGYALSIIRKQKKMIDDLLEDCREGIRIAEHGKVIIDALIDDGVFTEEGMLRVNEKIVLHRLDTDMMAMPGIAEKTSLLMRSNPSTKETLMSDTTAQPTGATVESAPKPPSRLRQFTTNHPKITRAAKLTAAAVGIVAVTRAVTNAQHNKDDLKAAADHAQESLDSMSDAVTLNDES